jgi:coenzyme F420-0:L-glutamate ligase / coenzyme F420-1:gamma-L-glutamate ligase
VISVHAADGAPEVGPGTDLADLVAGLFDLVDGDVVAVTSKVVSKAEGRVRSGTRDDSLAAETRRVVARRGATTIVRTWHGLILAAAGIDASNVAAGSVVLLPEDPDASARTVRDNLLARTGRNVGVLVTDTAGRPWREGQTDIAIGAAGLRVLVDLSGSVDAHGNELAVTAPAVADELAGAAELVMGKVNGVPAAVIRGLDLRGDGTGADIPIPEERDLFR